MPGQCGVDRCMHGFGVSPTTTRFFPHGAAHGRAEPQNVGIDFPLDHQRFFVAMQKFDRVFDGQNVLGYRPFDVADHRCLRGRLTAAGRTG